MTDSQQAIQKQTQPPAPQLQDKLEQVQADERVIEVYLGR